MWPVGIKIKRLLRHTPALQGVKGDKEEIRFQNRSNVFSSTIAAPRNE